MAAVANAGVATRTTRSAAAGCAASAHRRVPCWLQNRHQRCVPQASRRAAVRCDVSSRGQPEGSMGGNTDLQDVLVNALRLETQKVRVGELFDEKAALLKRLVAQTDEEYEQIARRTRHDIEKYSSALLAYINKESEIERRIRESRAEMALWNAESEEFQERLSQRRSEGLYFKSLYPSERERLKKKKFIADSLNNKAHTETRKAVKREVLSSASQVLYGCLATAVVFFLWTASAALVEGSSPDMRKLALFSVILFMLFSQISFLKKQ
eukprot:jgi/Chlat1/7816/Chrsp66S07271